MAVTIIGKCKVHVDRVSVSHFNARWPCSELESSRAYWFEFDQSGDLVDTDIPEHSDGRAALAMSDDCREFLLNGETAEWML